MTDRIDRSPVTQRGETRSDASTHHGDREPPTAAESEQNAGDRPSPAESETTPSNTERDDASTPGETTGADTVITALEQAGVDHLFGVQGGAIMPVYDAMWDADLTHVTMAHEQGAAHAADAHAQVSGEPAVCVATSGPGATNLVTGIADASMDSNPVVALTGQVPTEMVGNDAFQEADTTGVTAPVTKTNYFADDPDTVGDTVSEAVALAGEGRPGPTLVDLPKDVTGAETDAEPDEPSTPPTHDPPERADPDAVEAAATALAAAKRPVILAGGGVTKAEASPELRRFATKFEIPVVTTMPGLGTFPEDHDLSLGFAGMHGTGYANMAVNHCDCLFAVGTRFDDRLTGGIETFAPEAAVIHADIDRAEISKNVHADYPLVGDAATVMEQMFDGMPASPEAASWREQVGEWKRQYALAYSVSDDEPLKPQFVVEAVDRVTPPETIVTTGVGQHQMWACQHWTFTEPRTWISSHGLGTMGYGLPAAIGAKVAAPDTSVVCFDGDGSFLMTAQELAVAVRENLDITVFVLNNEAVGMVRQWQDSFFEGRRVASEYSWVPDFATFAEAFGANGYTLEAYDEVADTVESALADDGPSVVDVHINPEEDVYPMVPSGGANDQFALTEEHL